MKSHQAPNQCLLLPLKSSHSELGDVLLRPVLVLKPELVLPAVHGVRLEGEQGYRQCPCKEVTLHGIYLENVQGGDEAVGEVTGLGSCSSVLAWQRELKIRIYYWARRLQLGADRGS